MERILVHVSEFGSWVAFGKLKIDLRRIVLQDEEKNSIFQLLEAFGTVHINEPEAYVLVTLKNNWRQYIAKSVKSLNGSIANLDLEAVSSFQALTQDAELRLNSQTERLSIKLAPPEFEDMWRDYQKQFQLQEARESGAVFLSLYSFPERVGLQNIDISDIFLCNLLTRITDYKGERQLESLKESAEYGPTEFGMRISSSFDDNWRKNEKRYINFRKIRTELLFKKSWNDVDFLEFPSLCDSILSFSEESQNILGVNPFAAISYFKFYAEFVLQGNKLNLEAINKHACKLISMGHSQACFNFIFLLGCSIGPEQVSSIRYKLFRDKFPIFYKNKISQSKALLDFNLFKIVVDLESHLVLHQNESSNNLTTSDNSTLNEVTNVSNKLAKLKEINENEINPVNPELNLICSPLKTSLVPGMATENVGLNAEQPIKESPLVIKKPLKTNPSS